MARLAVLARGAHLERGAEQRRIRRFQGTPGELKESCPVVPASDCVLHLLELGSQFNGLRMEFEWLQQVAKLFCLDAQLMEAPGIDGQDVRPLQKLLAGECGLLQGLARAGRYAGGGGNEPGQAGRKQRGGFGHAMAQRDEVADTPGLEELPQFLLRAFQRSRRRCCRQRRAVPAWGGRLG